MRGRYKTKSLAKMAPRRRSANPWIVTLQRLGTPDRTVELLWLGAWAVVPDYFDRTDDLYAFTTVDFQARTALAVYLRTDAWVEREHGATSCLAKSLDKMDRLHRGVSA